MNKTLMSIAFGFCLVSNMAQARVVESVTIINNSDIDITARIGNGWWSWCNQETIAPGNKHFYHPDGGCANLPLRVVVWANGYQDCLNSKDYEYFKTMTLRVDKNENEKKLECYTIEYTK